MTPSREIASGLCWATAAIGIWSGSLVMLRLGVTTSLGAYDLAAIRIAVAALLLFPVIYRRGFAWDSLGIAGLSVMTIGFGAPYVLLMSLGLRYASAAAAGAINPGLMAAFVAVGGWYVFGDRFGLQKILGVVAIVSGAAAFTNVFTAHEELLGYAIFALTAVMWAGYVLVVRQAGIAALHATAIIAVGSAMVYLPIYAIALPKQVLEAPFPDVLLQAIYQGVLVSVVAVFAFNRSTERLGTTAGASLPALIPVTTLILGVVVLRETTTPGDIAAAVLIGVGVAFSLASRR